jgi:hypothetical protein
LIGLPGRHPKLRPIGPSGKPERYRKIPEPADAEDRSIVYETVFPLSGGVFCA